MLSACDLSASYGKFKALSGISFKLCTGTLTAVIGLNGSGKSTLVSTINGTLLYSGSLKLYDKELKDVPPRRRAQCISVLAQQAPAVPLTCFELALCGRSPYTGFLGRLGPDDIMAAEHALKALGIEHLRDRPLNRLSGGQRQKAYLAMIVAQDTPLVVLDEPATFMDMAYEKQFFKLIYGLKQDYKKTIICVMHNLNTAVRYADNFLVLHEGKLAFFGSRQDFLKGDIPQKIFNLKRYYADDGTGGEKLFFG